MTFDMQYALEHFTDILQAAPVAIWVTVFSAFLGLLGGAIFCTIRLNSIPLLSTIIGLLVSLIRSTPILVMECPVSRPCSITIPNWLQM